MACIERRPRCGAANSPAIPEPITRIGSIIGILVTIGGAAGGIIKGLETAGGIAAGLGAGSAGAIGGALAAIAIIIIIGVYIADRCISSEGLSECTAGVVTEIVQDFSEWTEELFPFTAMHDRVDIVVKSRYWNVVEDGEAKVFCTNEAPPRRSEIMRNYFFTKRVCDAGTGSLIGGTVGAVGGIIAAAAIAAAIGCATIIFCIFALLLAVLVAAVAVLVGALIGGQIAKAISEDTSPTATSGTVIAVGDLITIRGNMVKREFDENANVMWWVTSSALSGTAPSSIPNNPFSYCEIDEVFTMDTCPRG